MITKLLCLAVVLTTSLGIARAQATTTPPTISADNVGQLQQVSRLGEGYLTSDVAWVPGHPQQIMVTTSVGIAVYDVNHLDQPVRALDTNDLVFSLALEANRLVGIIPGTQTFELLDADDGEVMATLKDPFMAGVYQTTVSHDGKLAATSSIDGKIRLWDAATGQRLAVFSLDPISTYFPSPESSLRFSADGKLLAASAGAKAAVWETTTDAEVFSVSTPSTISSLVPLPDGSLLLGGNDGSLTRWRSSTESATFGSHAYAVHKIAVSDDGTLIASGSDDGVIKLWSLDGKLKAQLSALNQVVDMAFAPDNLRIAVMTPDKLVVLDVAQRVPVGSVQMGSRQIDEIAYSPDGKTLATVYSFAPNAVVLWDTATGAEKLPLQTTNFIQHVIFSPDGKRLAALGFDDSNRPGVSQWDAATGQRISSFPHPLVNGYADGLSGGMRGVAYSRDGSLLISSRGDGAIFVWDAQTGELRQTIDGDGGEVQTIALTTDERCLVVLSNNTDVAVSGVHLDDGTRAPFYRRADMLSRVYSMALSPLSANGPCAGTLALSTDPNHRLSLWDVASGRDITPKGSGTAAVAGLLAYSPNGKLIAVATGDYAAPAVVEFHDAATLQTVGQIEASGPITSLTFSPDGTTVATGMTDGTARLWQVGSD